MSVGVLITFTLPDPKGATDGRSRSQTGSKAVPFHARASSSNGSARDRKIERYCASGPAFAASSVMARISAILKDVGLVTSVRRGTWGYYSLAPDARDRLDAALASVLPAKVLA